MKAKLEGIDAYESRFPKGAIIDGVVDGISYFNSSIRIAWFLKEAYTHEPDGWHIKKYYAQENAYENFFKRAARPTWHPIIYASYGILNGFIMWENMPYIREKTEMCDVIKNIAIINASKLPSKTDTVTTYPNLNEGFSRDKDLVFSQVEVLQPEIHIFCRTFYLYKNSLGLTDEHRVIVENNFENCEVYLMDSKLYLDVYHPSNTKQLNEMYVNQIIKAVKFWKLNAVETISK
jgi:hypothetical protein